MRYSKLFYCKNSRRYREKKTETRKRSLGFSSFFGFVQTYFCDFSGCRRSILISETVIRFVFPLAFQCRIPNYSTAKTQKIWRKESGKPKMIAQLFFICWIRSNIFRDFSGYRRSILISETIIRFVFPLAFQHCI